MNDPRGGPTAPVERGLLRVRAPEAVGQMRMSFTKYKCSLQACSFLPPPRARRFSQRVALTWEPSRLQRGPYTGRGAKLAGLVSDRTRSFSSLEFLPPPLEHLLNSFLSISSPIPSPSSLNSLLFLAIPSTHSSSSSPAPSLLISPLIMVTHPS